MSTTESDKSPDGQYSIEFEVAGEIRFGPEYYRLTIDGQKVAEQIFGQPYIWDAESKYLALQEWLTTDEQKGPLTALLVMDLRNRRIARVSQADKGFIEPIRFDGNKVIYKKVHLSQGRTTEYEVDLKEVKNWSSYLE